MDLISHGSALYEQFLTQSENSIELKFTRDDPDPKLSFSKEVYEDLTDYFLAFLAARLMRAWNANQRVPHELTVSIRVEAL